MGTMSFAKSRTIPPEDDGGLSERRAHGIRGDRAASAKRQTGSNSVTRRRFNRMLIYRASIFKPSSAVPSGLRMRHAPTQPPCWSTTFSIRSFHSLANLTLANL